MIETPDDGTGTAQVTYEHRFDRRSGGSTMTLPCTLGHYIGGRAVAGSSRRSGPVYNPATGEAARRSSLATADETRAAIQAARAALPAWAATPPLQRARVLFRFKALLEAHTDELAALITQRARQGACRCARRSHARHRGRRVRLRHPASAEGRVLATASAAASTAGRCASRSACAPASRRSTFPAMVPMWMFPIAIACGNTFVLKPSEKDPVVRAAARGTADRSRAAAGRIQRGQRRSRSGRRAAHGSRRGGGELRRLDAGRASTSTRRLAQHGKRVQALGGAKNHMVVMPDADPEHAAQALDGRGLWLGRRALHGDLGRRRGRRRGRPAGRDAATAIAALKIGAGTRDGVEMGPLVTREHLERVRGYVDARRAGRREAGRRRPRARGGRPSSRASSSAPSLFDHVQPRHAHLPGRDLRPGARRRARRRISTRALELVERARVRQRHGDLHARRRQRAQVRAVGAGRHGRHQRADPGADGLPQLRRLEALAVRRRCTCTARTACASTRASRPSPRAGRAALAAAPSSSCRR